jgi:hypothetical protein
MQLIIFPFKALFFVVAIIAMAPFLVVVRRLP